MADSGRYELSGYRYSGGPWKDVEAGAKLPHGKSWGKVDLITINFAPETEDGYYRSAVVFGGFDYPPDPRYIYPPPPTDGWTLDDLAYELALEYSFIAQ